MAKQMMKLTVEEVRANIPYDLICMVRYGCTWSSGRRRRAWLADFSESEREAAGRLFRMAHNWTVGRGVPDTVQMSRKTFQLWQKLGVHLKGEASSWRTTLLKPFFHRRKHSTSS